MVHTLQYRKFSLNKLKYQDFGNFLHGNHLTLLRPEKLGSVLFLDAAVRLPAGEPFVFDESFDVDSARLGLFRSSLDGSIAEWHVFHGDGQGGGAWLNTGVLAEVDPLTNFSINWTRLTVREDLSTQTWKKV